MSKKDQSSGVFISLGSNLGFDNLSSSALLRHAIDRLEKGGDQVLAASSFWLSNAWPPNSGAPDFINAVCRIHPFDTDPARLLQRLHAIENEFGRVRSAQNQWLARTLDLDLLDYNGLVSKNYSFPVLPHPRLIDRDFVLLPLLEVSGDWADPITGRSGQLLLNSLLQSGHSNNCRVAQI